MTIELSEYVIDAIADAVVKKMQQPCEDAISRLAVLEFIADFDLSMGQVVKKIHALPPVTPQPKTGHWIKIKPYPLQMHEYECSECSHETDDNTENYCSECGAKMESEDEE